MNYNNKNQIISYFGSTMSSMLNNQVSGYYNENQKKIILKKDNKLNTNKDSINKKSNLETKLLNLNKFSNKINSNLSLIKNNKSVETRTQLILNVKNNTVSILEPKIEENLNNVNTTSSLKFKGKKYYGVIDMLTPTTVKSNNVLNKIRVNTINNENLSSDITVSKLLRSFYKIDSDIATSQYLVYNFNNNKKKIVKNLTSILNNAFYSMSSIISKPVLNITPNKIVIHLFYYLTKSYNKNIFNKYRKSNYYKNLSYYKKLLFKKFVFKKFLSYNHRKFKLLCIKLSKLLKKPVELELVRLHYRYNETQILAKTLGLLGDKFRKPFRSFAYRTFGYAGIIDPTKSEVNVINPIIPSFITGISVKLAGRLSSQKTIPRKTVKRIQRGTIIRTNAQLITSSRFTKKNRKGIFSVTVSMGHRFF